MGAVWELKPFRQALDTKNCLSSVLQINHYVGELNARKEGGLKWATGTTALGTPKPFDGKLTLVDGTYKFDYYITHPEQGFIYYNASPLKQQEDVKSSVLSVERSPNIIKKPSSEDVNKGVTMGVISAIMLRILAAGLMVIPN
jgi:hypothetical protein